MSKIEFFDRDMCWEWCGGKTGNGYGVMRVNGKNKYAHRISLELSGAEIPFGMFALHSCNNPSCVNPAHLRVGNSKENAQDVLDSNRNPQVNKKMCPQGHEYSDENTFISRANKRYCRICKRKYMLNSYYKRKSFRNPSDNPKEVG